MRSLSPHMFFLSHSAQHRKIQILYSARSTVSRPTKEKILVSNTDEPKRTPAGKAVPPTGTGRNRQSSQALPTRKTYCRQPRACNSPGNSTIRDQWREWFTGPLWKKWLTKSFQFIHSKWNPKLFQLLFEYQKVNNQSKSSSVHIFGVFCPLLFIPNVQVFKQIRILNVPIINRKCFTK